MKRSIKRLLACILIVVVISTCAISAFAADTTDYGSGTVNGTVTINGLISSLTISVTHPLTAKYLIDPNYGASGLFVAPDITVQNNTKVPVNVTVNSLTATSGGTLSFTDVMPGEKEWASLNLADSKKYLALGILVKDSTGWADGYATTTMYAASKVPTLFGTLPTGETGTFTMTANYGLAFDGEFTANHSLVFMFELN